MSQSADPGDSRTYFEQVATEWAELRKSLFPDTVRDAVLQAAELAEGSVAADIGAGNGFLAEAFLNARARVIAVDRSEAMLNTLAGRLPGRAVEVRQGEAESLPIETGSLDCAAANMYLHHVDDPEAAIREMARVLRPGGRLVLSDLDRHEHAWVLAQYHDRWPGFDRDQIRGWMERAGLSEISVTTPGHECCGCSEETGESVTLSMFLARGVK